MEPTPPIVTLEAAGPADAPLLSNLLELYIHDLSAVFPNVELGADGRFGYEKLPLYWSEPERRFAFVVRSSGKPAGFALVTRGSPVAEDPQTLDVAEFFVLRRFRRSGVGTEAAFLLFGVLPGSWTIRVSAANTNALAFWTAAVAEFTQGTAREFEVPGPSSTWHVFAFAGGPGR